MEVGDPKDEVQGGLVVRSAELADRPRADQDRAGDPAVQAFWALSHTISTYRREWGERGVYVPPGDVAIRLPDPPGRGGGTTGRDVERQTPPSVEREGCLNKPHNPQVEADFVAGYLAAGVGGSHLQAFVCRIIPCESSWWTYAVSTGGHLGLSQFAPSTWNSVASKTGRHDWRNPYDQGFNSAVLAAESGLGPWSCR